MDVESRDRLVGNRWVLVGGILYLLEWVAIIGVGVVGVSEFVLRGSAAADVLSTYADHPDAMWAMAGWFAVVLLGRILLFVGLRSALVDSGRSHPLLDFAVVAAAVSVTLEIGSYGLAAGASTTAELGEEGLTLAIDQAAVGLNLMLGGGLGVAVASSVYVMWRSGLFSPWLNMLGAVSGVAMIGAQLSVAPALQGLFDILFVSPILFWIWMLWAGVVLWRRTPAQRTQAGAEVSAALP
ncbi:hypothetical protein [Nocardioides coralli]|uniref:hypothetical protein n=1 Tax=Nocardioides coralli TaxID=2872154 RepID=UPI001CA3C533|nr:hypothetical protein [Nocardioides coralli]QZY28209.1 hypothetical protein K6T13_12035 [Nocardioides coralli]